MSQSPPVRVRCEIQLFLSLPALCLVPQFVKSADHFFQASGVYIPILVLYLFYFSITMSSIVIFFVYKYVPRSWVASLWLTYWIVPVDRRYTLVGGRRPFSTSDTTANWYNDREPNITYSWEVHMAAKRDRPPKLFNYIFHDQSLCIVHGLFFFFFVMDTKNNSFYNLYCNLTITTEIRIL